MAGPLKGIKVIDMSRYIAGPQCCMLLADMGADVIKVERRGRGEDSRELIPFKENGDSRVSLYYTQYNKNKKSLALDLYSDEAKEIITKLLEQADVLVENFRPGTLAKMGFTKERLQEINPGLVVTSISGFGQEGKLRDRAAFDCIGQAMGGLMGITGPENGEPLLAGTWVGDFTTAVYAAFGTVCALYDKKQSGLGNFLDLSLVECVSSILATVIPDYVANGRLQPLRGNRDTVCAPANLFKAKDGYVYFHGGTQPLFKRLCTAMNRMDLLENEKFKTVEARMAQVDEIEAIVQSWCDGFTAEELEALLAEHGLVVGKCRTVKDIVEDEDLKNRQSIIYADYPGVGEIALPGIPVKMSRTPGEFRMRPPLLGEHNEEILKNVCHMTDEEIRHLKEINVI